MLFFHIHVYMYIYLSVLKASPTHFSVLSCSFPSHLLIQIKSPYIFVKSRSLSPPQPPPPHTHAIFVHFESLLPLFSGLYSYSCMCRIRSDNSSHALPSGANEGGLQPRIHDFTLGESTSFPEGPGQRPVGEPLLETHGNEKI